MLIGLAGKFGAGKDAVADVLVERFGFKKLSFAEPLRKECAAHIKNLGTDYHVTPFDWELSQTGLSPVMMWVKPTHPLIRQLLQWWGTDYRRAQDPDYWVKRTAESLHGREAERIVITDARFPNEAAMVKLHGKLWLVRRPTQQLTEHHQHVSEAFADEYTGWDLIINNDSDLAHLDGRVSAIMRCEFELERLAQERLTATAPTHRFGIDLGELDWTAERGRIAAENNMPNPDPEITPEYDTTPNNCNHARISP